MQGGNSSDPVRSMHCDKRDGVPDMAHDVLFLYMGESYYQQTEIYQSVIINKRKNYQKFAAGTPRKSEQSAKALCIMYKK